LLLSRLCFLKENIPSVSIQCLTEHGPLIESDVIDIAAQLVMAVGYLHENNLVHANLQPRNVYLDWNGMIKIGDFSNCQVGNFVCLCPFL
jgi:hypothetical protein